MFNVVRDYGWIMDRLILGLGLVLLVCGCGSPDVTWKLHEFESKQGKILVFEESGIYIVLEGIPGDESGMSSGPITVSGGMPTGESGSSGSDKGTILHEHSYAWGVAKMAFRSINDS